MTLPAAKQPVASPKPAGDPNRAAAAGEAVLSLCEAAVEAVSCLAPTPSPKTARRRRTRNRVPLHPTGTGRQHHNRHRPRQLREPLPPAPRRESDPARSAVSSETSSLPESLPASCVSCHWPTPQEGISGKQWEDSLTRLRPTDSQPRDSCPACRLGRNTVA